MKILFLDKKLSPLSDKDTRTISVIKNVLLSTPGVEIAYSAEKADAIILQEENSFKNFRYIKDLESDELISAYPEKVFTINSDDCATGLLRGLYTSLPKYRYNSKIHEIVPYMHYPNDLVFRNDEQQNISKHLAVWRGNIKSNRLRSKLMDLMDQDSEFCIEETESWLNHDLNEKKSYVSLILSSKFSLCPAGWAPVSYRIYESMALGRCPVIIADHFVPPKGPKWNDFALFIPEKDLAMLSSSLRSKEESAKDLGRKAFEEWQAHFSDAAVEKYYANALLSLIDRSPKTSRTTELKRWRSLSMYWNNKWTLPQRILNKIR